MINGEGGAWFGISGDFSCISRKTAALRSISMASLEFVLAKLSCRDEVVEEAEFSRFGEENGPYAI